MKGAIFMKSKVTVLLSVAVMLAVLVGTIWQSGYSQGSDPPAPVTQPTRLFSLTYGKEPGQIYLRLPAGEGEIGTGPSDFKVAWDGNAFYFAGSRQVKVFDRQGQLIRALTSNLKQLDRVAVTPSGTVYLMTPQDDGAVFEVFDAQGQRQPEQAHTLEAAVNGLKWCGLDFFTADATGNLYTGTIVDNNDSLKVLRISPNGQTKTLPGGAIDRQNGSVWYEESVPPLQSVTREIYEAGQMVSSSEETAFAPLDVIVYNGDGQEVRRFRLPIGGLNSVEQSLCFSLEISKVDSSGRIYIVGEPRRLDWVNTDNRVNVLKYFVILSYDGQGNRVGVRAVYNKPRYGSAEAPRQQWDVDRDGNVYYLDFKADHVDVMMAPAP